MTTKTEKNLTMFGAKEAQQIINPNAKIRSQLLDFIRELESVNIKADTSGILADIRGLISTDLSSSNQSKMGS